jgi:hypothetical protein
MLKLNKTATVLIWLLVGYLFMVEMSGVMIASMELVFILVAILAYGWLSKVRKTSEQEERPQPAVRMLLMKWHKAAKKVKGGNREEQNQKKPPRTAKDDCKQRLLNSSIHGPGGRPFPG